MDDPLRDTPEPPRVLRHPRAVARPRQPGPGAPLGLPKRSRERQRSAVSDQGSPALPHGRWLTANGPRPERGRLAAARRIRTSMDDAAGEILERAATAACAIRQTEIAAGLEVVRQRSEVAVISELPDGKTAVFSPPVTGYPRTRRPTARRRGSSETPERLPPLPRPSIPRDRSRRSDPRSTGR